MEIIFSSDTNEEGTNMDQVAKINGYFYPYNYDQITNLVLWGSKTSELTEAGILAVSKPYSDQSNAMRILKTRNAGRKV